MITYKKLNYLSQSKAYENKRNDYKEIIFFVVVSSLLLAKSNNHLLAELGLLYKFYFTIPERIKFQTISNS